MKLIILLFVIIAQGAIAQKSYQFKNTVPPLEREVASVDASHFGIYKGDLALRYEFSVDGIAVISLNVNSISRETLRESSKYQVRNGYIFGVEEGDSLPCVLEGDSYYFGIRNRKIIAGKGSMNKLIQLTKNSYVLNFYDDGNYTPIYFNFKRRKLQVQQFDYEIDGVSDFEQVLSQSSIQKDQLEIVILNPTPAEWNNLNMSSYVTDEKEYVRE